MKLPTLYGKDSSDGLKLWEVFTSEDVITVRHGKLNGKIQEKHTTTVAMNIGRSNATTPSEQADIEALAKWVKQKKKGYFETKEEALGFVTRTPMKAQNFNDYSRKVKYPCYIQPKLNGCFGYNTKILTSQGHMAIGDIVNTKASVLVASYNETTNTIEYNRVVNWFNNGMKKRCDWLLFNKKLKITKNHKVYSGGVWEKAEEVSGELFGVNPRFTGIVAGMLLGDSVANIEKRAKVNGDFHSWRLSFSVAEADYDFGVTKSKLFSEVNWKESNRTSGYGHPQKLFTSATLSKSPFDLSLFYSTDRNSTDYGRRNEVIDCKALKEVFTDDSLAIWFMDDGSLNYNNGNADTPRMFLCVARYSEESIQGFLKLFKDKYGVNPSLGYYGKDKRLSFTTPDSWYLLSRIAKVAEGMCTRKVPDVFKLGSIPPVEMFCGVDSIIGSEYSRGDVDSYYEAFDIEVENNNNYFAEGVLVHNCRMMIDSDGSSQSKQGESVNFPKHWEDDIQQLVSLGMMGCDGIDGEVFAGHVKQGGLSLQQIVSAFRKPNENTHKLFFAMYDVCTQGYQDTRINDMLLIQSLGLVNSVSVPTILVNSPEEADVWYAKWLDDGAEGMVYRQVDGLYEYGKRSYNLIKRKPRQDAEAKVVGCVADKNNAGLLSCVLQNGVQFKCLMRVDSHPDIDYRKYENALTLIGGYITFEFEELSDSGVPTKPVGVGVREMDLNWEALS